MIKLIDYLGNTIAVGDTVIYTGSYVTFSQGKVAKTCAKMIGIQRFPGRSTGLVYKYPKEVIVRNNELDQVL